MVETIIQVDLQMLLKILLACLVSVMGMIFGFGRMLLSQFEKRMSERFDAQDRMRDARLAAIEERLTTESMRLKVLVDEVHLMHARLPLEYVRREDWIRLSNLIDAKLDRLADKIDNVRERRDGA